MNKKDIIVIMVICIGIISYFPVGSALDNMEGQSPPSDSLDITEKNIDIYEYSETDHDANIIIGVENNHNERVKSKVELTPVLDTEAELNTHTEFKTVEPNETIELNSKWTSGSDKEKRIESVNVELYACSDQIIMENCTEVTNNDG